MALALQRLEGAAAQAFRMAAIVVVSAGVVVGRLTRQQVINRDEDRVGDGDDGFLVAAMREDAALAGGAGARGRARARGQRGLDEGGAQPAVGGPRLPRPRSCAIHTQSFRSVVRPGPWAICAALARIQANASSRT